MLRALWPPPRSEFCPLQGHGPCVRVWEETPMKAAVPPKAALPPEAPSTVEQGRGLCLRFKGSHRKADPGSPGPPGPPGPESRRLPAALPEPGCRTPASPPAALLRPRGGSTHKKTRDSHRVRRRLLPGRHLWSARCSQDAGTPGPGTEAARPTARPQRQKLLLESKWKISGRPRGCSGASAVSPEAGRPGVRGGC